MNRLLKFICIIFGIISFSSLPSCAKDEVIGIVLDTSNCKKDFYVDDPFTYEGLEVSKIFNSSKEEILLESEYKVSTVDITTSGIKTVEVKYMEFVEKYLVSYANKDDRLLGIEVSGNYKTKYNEGEVFQSQNLVVEALYAKQKIQVFDYTLSINRGLKIEDKSIDVIYKDFKKTIEITVTKDEISWGDIS